MIFLIIVDEFWAHDASSLARWVGRRKDLPLSTLRGVGNCAAPELPAPYDFVLL